VIHRIVLLRALLRAPAPALPAMGLLCAAALLSVCPAQATAFNPANPDIRPGLAVSGASAVQDPWTHDRQVIANLVASPPAEPVVCILGGSAVRECTVSEAEWAAQVQRLGTTALTYNLGSSMRTLAESVALMEALPAGKLNMIVIVGVNLGCFESAETSATVTLPAAVFPLPAWTEHLRSQDKIWSVAAKRSSVTWWKKQKYPVFKADYSTAKTMLEKLITVCQERGLHPVLIDLPRNMAIIGHALDTPVNRFRRTCFSLSEKYSIPFVSGFNRVTKLVNRDFFDNWHLVEPGRVKWQKRLSQKTADLLQLYGLSSTGSGVAQ
jgi:hypothetical protein